MWWTMMAAVVGCTVTEESDVTDAALEMTPFEHATAACQQGDAAQCTALAKLHASGEGTEADPARAAELFSQACGGGDPDGCIALAKMHATGEGMPRDLARSAALYGQACEAESPSGCHQLALLLLDARGVPADARRAVTLLEGACTDAHADSCRTLADLYALGAKVPRDEAAAKSYARAGCGHGDGFACARLAERQILDGEDREARKTLEALVTRDPELSTVPALVVRGLQLAAGEKSDKIGTALIEAWRATEENPSEWSWKALSAHLADEKRKKSRVSRIVIELLDAPRAGGTESALAAALDLPG